MEMSASPPFRGNRAYIGMGSNLGDSLATLRAATVRLGDLGAVVAASPVYETDPVGLESQPVFLNAVVVLDTTLEPIALLDGLLAIEADFHRERTVRWGPRTLDLDLLWYAGRLVDTERLTLPHARAHEREFVLRPLADLAPELPLAGSTAGRLLAGLPGQGVRPTDHRLT
ncbi:MAG: 2-amino-4-hydroxy-6-hydroxymethyldihydropteridine diphosphokinase [Gaiellales bacterium]|jgi:2-amino-4-hydroxy-6-hydroxymethyldihydropteridine diphosphokinase|nr:2-amino-4-hydroxy-6-hydroxymethyldihydropteridine diphosphokinase [Gaiellales bacterium]